MKATPRLLLSLSSLLLLHLHDTLATSGVGRDDSSQLTLLDTADARLTSGLGKHGPAQDGTATALDSLQALRDAVEVMQGNWFELWIGTWPTAIDWTAAVIDTHLVASLNTLSKALNSTDTVGEPREVENELSHYFSQNVRETTPITGSNHIMAGVGLWKACLHPPCSATFNASIGEHFSIFFINPSMQMLTTR